MRIYMICLHQILVVGVRFGCCCCQPVCPAHSGQCSSLHRVLLTEIGPHKGHAAQIVIEIWEKRPEYNEEAQHLCKCANDSPAKHNKKEAAEVDKGALDLALLGEELEDARHPDEEVQPQQEQHLRHPPRTFDIRIKDRLNSSIIPRK